MIGSFARVRPSYTKTADGLRIELSPQLGLRRMTNALVLAGLGVVLLQRGEWNGVKPILYEIAGFAAIIAAFAAVIRRSFLDVSAATLAVGSAYGPIKHAEEYVISSVHNLRILAAGSARETATGTLAFDHDGDTVRFGQGMSAADAEAMRQKILDIAPTVAQPRSVLGLE